MYSRLLEGIQLQTHGRMYVLIFKYMITENTPFNAGNEEEQLLHSWE